jgi:hypothetical protein
MSEKYFLRSTCRDMTMSGFTKHCDKDGCSVESITDMEIKNMLVNDDSVCYECNTSDYKCVCPPRPRVVCDCEHGCSGLSSDRCSMCNKEDAKYYDNLPWCTVPWFCNDECKIAFCTFVESGYIDLTHGVPYEINENSAFFKDKCATNEPVECANCGAKENIVRNLIMFEYEFDYKHSDFCKNNKCQSNYINYIKNGTTDNEIPYVFRDK